MKIGFTGTRHGMTLQQRAHVEAMLAGALVADASSEFHHGDCVGADVQAAQLAFDLGFRVVAHPPIKTALRAYFLDVHETREPASYTARNRAIVDGTELLIGCPPTKEHQPFGGSWMTIDYARRCGKRVIVIAPDGTVDQGRAGE